MFFQTCMSFFVEHEKNIFWRLLVIEQLMVPIDFHSIFPLHIEVNGNQQLFGSKCPFSESQWGEMLF